MVSCYAKEGDRIGSPSFYQLCDETWPASKLLSNKHLNIKRHCP
jgi:hypothetical protein